MSDPNKYINVYIENSLSLVHEYINILLKTKTEARLMEEVLKDKDLEIARLTEEVTGLRSNSSNVGSRCISMECQRSAQAGDGIVVEINTWFGSDNYFLLNGIRTACGVYGSECNLVGARSRESMNRIQ